MGKMKDAKGHGSNPRGTHSAGIDQVGQPETALIQDYHDKLYGALNNPAEFNQIHDEIKGNPQMSNNMVADLAKKFSYGRQSDSRKKNLEHIWARHQKLMSFVDESERGGWNKPAAAPIQSATPTGNRGIFARIRSAFGKS